MPRHLLNALTALSVLALAGLVYVYLWSVAEGLGMGEYSRRWETEHATYWINCRMSGDVRFTVGKRIPPGHRVAYPTTRAATDHRTERALFAGIRVGRSDNEDVRGPAAPFQYDWLTLPIPYLLVPAALLPLARLRRYLLKRRAAARAREESAPATGATV